MERESRRYGAECKENFFKWSPLIVFKSCLFLFPIILFPHFGNANEVHVELYHKVTEISQEMEQLRSRINRLKVQAQAVVREVDQLKEKKEQSEQYRKALEEQWSIELMGSGNRNSCHKNNLLSSNKKSSICKKNYITFWNVH
ncbi:MAG: hypothetical protein OXH36_00410 [Bdellovibrionales bacterium]|nr:hypothetical protein [Bdellovibrionales bacterium]